MHAYSQKLLVLKGSNLLTTALDPADEDLLDKGPEDERPEGDGGVAAAVVQQEGVAHVDQVEHGDEEAHVVHHRVGHRTVHRVRHRLQERLKQMTVLHSLVSN